MIIIVHNGLVTAVYRDSDIIDEQLQPGAKFKLTCNTEIKVGDVDPDLAPREE